MSGLAHLGASDQPINVTQSHASKRISPSPSPYSRSLLTFFYRTFRGWRVSDCIAAI